MFNISKEFAPPFKLIVPYFIAGILFYVLSMGAVFFIEGSMFSFHSISLKVWAHLFLLGFVIFIIIGAMAQLIPVVLEIGHYKVELFYAIFPFLTVGIGLLLGGFLVHIKFLPIGGAFVLLALSIYLFNLFMTLKKVEKFTIVVKSVLISNLFLALGLVFGFIMALNYVGIVSIDMPSLLKSHVYLLICGYVTITIMGISLILVPMFGLSHGFNDQPITVSLYVMTASVVIVVLSALLKLSFFEYFGYFLSLVAYGLYIYQIAMIYKQRARKENDIWVKSMMVSFAALGIALFFVVMYFIHGHENYLLSSGFLFFVGFLGFIITAHLYKIVPFLVWFHRFSPLVGKQKVPMLAEMVPKKSAHYQFVFTTVGTALSALALLFNQEILLKVGGSFLTVGALYLGGSVYFMLNFKGK